MNRSDSKVVPITGRQDTQAADASQPPPPAQAPLRILIIDDTPEDRMIVRLALESHGYLLSEVDTGERGLAAAAALVPDCILLDNRLPDLDGIEVLDALRQDDGTMPCAVVMMTASGDGRTAAALLKAGALDYLDKKYLGEDSLRRAVQGAVERHRTVLGMRTRNQRLAQIARASSRLVLETADRSTVARSVLAELSESLGYELFFQYDADAAKRVLRLASWRGLTPEQRASFSEIRFGQFLCGIVAERRQPMIVECLDRSAFAEAAALRKAGVTFYAGFPLLAQGELLGTAAFATRRRSRPDDGELQHIQTLCDLAAGQLARARAGATLKASEGRLALFIENAPAAIAMFDREMRYMAASRRYAIDYGVPGGTALVGRSHYEVFPEIQQRWRDLHARVLDGEELSEDEDAFQRSDGRTEWVRWTMRPWLEADGSVGGVLLFSEVRTEQVEARRALMASEARYRSVIQSHTELLCRFRQDGTLTLVNEAYGAAFGRPPAELVGTNLFELIPPDDRELVRSTLARLTPEHPNNTAVHHVIGPDGSIRVMEWTNTLLSDEEGGDQFQATGRDITDRVRAEEALRGQARRQQLLLEVTQELIGFHVDEAALAATVYQRIAAVFDADVCFCYRLDPATDSLTLVFSHGVPEDQRAAAASLTLGQGYCGTAAATGQPIAADAAGIASDPTGRSVREIGVSACACHPLRAADGRILGTFSVASTSRDAFAPEEISFFQTVSNVLAQAWERNVAERELRESERRLELALRASATGVWDCDVASGRLAWSGHIYPIFGIDRFEGTLEAFFRLVHPEDRERLGEAVDAAIAEGELQFEFRVVRPDGEVRWVDNHAILIRDTAGRAARLLGTVNDVTERRHHAEHTRLLMQEVNHRSKNMLALIQAIARLTQTSDSGSFIERFSRRVQALAANQDLLVKADWKAVSLEELVRSQLAHFSGPDDARVVLDGPPLQVTASASQTLGMALHELATNAAKYGALSNDTGRVAVSWCARADAAGAIRFSMSWAESGGPPVEQPARRGFGSTVTGTMIKRSLGCDTQIDYGPGGVVWSITCLADNVLEGRSARAAASPEATVVAVPSPSAGARRVLVVEDEALIAMEIADALAAQGYEVIGPAGSVTEAMSLLAQGGCDLAVLDVNLGSGTSEPVARELLRAGTPFITVSGYSREQQPASMREAPLIGKPLNVDLLIAEIERRLRAA